MNDRFLFRGKRVDDGEWVIGFYISVAHSNDDTHRHCFILPLDCCVDCGVEDDKRIYEVDPATVCQCSGIKDKVGRLIFEGDVVVDGMDRKGVVRWNDKAAAFISCFINPTGRFKFTLLDTNATTGEMLEILGNVHDNPELLEAKNE